MLVFIKNLRLKLHKPSFKGFSLIELMVTVSIIGILATIGIAQYNRALVRSEKARVDATMLQIYSGMELFHAEWLVYTGALPAIGFKLSPPYPFAFGFPNAHRGVCGGENFPMMGSPIGCGPIPGQSYTGPGVVYKEDAYVTGVAFSRRMDVWCSTGSCYQGSHYFTYKALDQTGGVKTMGWTSEAWGDFGGSYGTLKFVKGETITDRAKCATKGVADCDECARRGRWAVSATRKDMLVENFVDRDDFYSVIINQSKELERRMSGLNTGTRTDWICASSI